MTDENVQPLQTGYEYNESLISEYNTGLERAKKVLYKDFLKVHDYNSGRALSDWQLLQRQLTQEIAMIELKLIEPLRRGSPFDENDDLITVAYNNSILGFVKLLGMARTHLEVVNQQVKKLTPVIEKAAFIDERTFEPIDIFTLHEKLNKDLFDNTIPELYMALNAPNNVDYKINFIASNQNMIYYFISKLGLIFHKTNFGEQMCIKHDIDKTIFSTSKNKASKGSKNEQGFAKRFDKVLDDIIDNRTKTK